MTNTSAGVACHVAVATTRACGRGGGQVTDVGGCPAAGTALVSFGGSRRSASRTCEGVCTVPRSGRAAPSATPGRVGAVVAAPAGAGEGSVVAARPATVVLAAAGVVEPEPLAWLNVPGCPCRVTIA